MRRDTVWEKGGVLILGAYAVLLAWLSGKVSILDDDWGHLRLVGERFPEVLTTSWTGLVGVGGYYRPVVVFSMYLNYLLSSYDPALYHVANVGIHCGCGVLVFLLAYRLFAHRGVAWASMALFVVLPIHTDSLFWIVGRTDSVCTLFYLGSLVMFLDYLKQSSRWQLVGFGVCAGLAFLSKEMALSLPGILIALAVYKGALGRVEARRSLVVVVVLLLVYFALRFVVLGGFFKGVEDRRFSIFVWGLQAAKAVAKIGMTDHKWFGGVVLLTTGAFFIWQRKPGIRDLLFPGGWMLLCLVPVLGHLHNWYLYLPSVFACIAVAAVWVLSGNRVLYGALACLVVYYGVVLVREGLFWQEASKISEHFVEEVLEQAEDIEGTLYVMNVPSAYMPEGSFGGKSLMAYALKNALEMQGNRNFRERPVMVNHLWMLDKTFDCALHRRGPGRYDLNIRRGGFFSFHHKGASSVYGADGTTVLQTVLEKPWGKVTITGEGALTVQIDLQAHDRVLFYNRGEIQRVDP